jgi:glycosidase
MAPDVDTRTVAIQEHDPSSVLATYRLLLWLRRRHPALQVGSYRRLSTVSRALFAFERSTPEETIVVAVNFGPAPTGFELRTGRRWGVLFDTHPRAAGDLSSGDVLTLGPREAIMLVARAH